MKGVPNRVRLIIMVGTAINNTEIETGSSYFPAILQNVIHHFISVYLTCFTQCNVTRKIGFYMSLLVSPHCPEGLNHSLVIIICRNHELSVF